jgi:hypothetical protein
LLCIPLYIDYQQSILCDIGIFCSLGKYLWKNPVNQTGVPRHNFSALLARIKIFLVEEMVSA